MYTELEVYNFTTTNNTNLDSDRTYQHNVYSFIISISLLIILTILGNGLVFVTVIKSRELQLSVANYFVFSQAIADLMVATLAMPSWIFIVLYPLSSDQSMKVTILSQFVDILCCSASIANVSLISLDRFWAVNYPLRYYEVVTPRRAKSGIAFSWMFAVSIATLSLGGITGSEIYIQAYLILIVLSCFLIPLTIIVVAYCHIYKAAMKQIQKMNLQMRRRDTFTGDDQVMQTKRRDIRRKRFFKELRITKAVAVVVGLFVICWGPFFAIHLIERFFPRTAISNPILELVVWLPYVFCCVNPWIYAGLNRDMLLEIKNMIKNKLLIAKCRQHIAEGRSSSFNRELNSQISNVILSLRQPTSDITEGSS